MMEITSKQARKKLSVRHCHSVFRKRASNCPRAHQMARENAATRQNVEPSKTARVAGPFAKAAKEAAAPIVIAHPLGLYQSIQTPAAKPVGLARSPSRRGGPLRPM